jgi:hypothetical protein
MFTLFGERQRFCDGISRRNFLKIGALGAGLTLADLLRLRAGAGTTSTSRKSAIMINLPGGPSHMDMYDLKPDAPMEFRGEFKPINTNVSGVQICEYFPLQAQMWDKFAVIRSVIGGQEHSDSQTNTGYHEFENRTAHHPSLGAVMSKLRGSGESEIPPFVSLRACRRASSRASWAWAIGRSRRTGRVSRTFTSRAASIQTARRTARRCWRASTTFAASWTPRAR